MDQRAKRRPGGAGKQTVAVPGRAPRNAEMRFTIGMVSAFLLLGFGSVMAAGQPVSPTLPVDTLPSHLHHQTNLLVWPPPGEDLRTHDCMLSPTAAADSASAALRCRGVEAPLICEARWITGAVSGYLVDAMGDLAVEDLHYSAFRIGIRNEAEAQHGAAFRAGTVFTFFAMGIDSTGARIWYPTPGPDITPSQAESLSSDALAYEFLLDRGAFETLPRRYPRGESNE